MAAPSGSSLGRTSEECFSGSAMHQLHGRGFLSAPPAFAIYGCLVALAFPSLVSFFHMFWLEGDQGLFRGYT